MNGIRSAAGFVIVSLHVMMACSSRELVWSDTSETPVTSAGTEGGNAQVGGSNGVGGTMSDTKGGSGAGSAGGAAAPVDLGGDNQGLGGSVGGNSVAVAGAAAGSDAGAGGMGASDIEGCPPGCCSSTPVEEAKAAGRLVIAESVHGFSDTQGQCGWSYGYFPSGEAPFTLLSRFGALSSPVWRASANSPPWSMIARESQHPNQVPLQWIVRRWTSHVDGEISIRGHVAKEDTDGGDGIVAQLRVDGLARWETTVAFDDERGHDFEIAVSVMVGSTIDFIVAPKDGDAHDATAFTASISRP